MVYSMLECRYYLGETPHYDQVYPGEHEAIIDRELWEKAQALRAERAMYKINRGPSPNILLGFIVDSFGQPMTIADDSTKGRRYRYYISNQAKWAVRSGVKRFRAEADALEQLVLVTLGGLLAGREQLRALLTTIGVQDPKLQEMAARGTEAGQRLATATLTQKRLILLSLLRRLEVSRNELTLVIRSGEAARFLDWNGRRTFRASRADRHREQPTWVLRVPVSAVRFQRSLVLPVEPRDPQECGARSPALIALIDQARRGQAALDANRDFSVAEVAATFHRQPSFFARIVRLNYLAPDIIAAILDGRQPPGLTRKQLVMANLPMDWGLQRRLFGFKDLPNAHPA